MLAALLQGGLPVQVGLRFRAGHQGEGVAGLQGGPKDPHVDVVFNDIILAAKLFDAEEIILVPGVFRPIFGLPAEQVEGLGFFMDDDARPVGDGFARSVPIVGDGGVVVVAVVNQCLGVQFQRPAGAAQVVLYVGCVGPGLHPDPLFQQGVANGVAPDGGGALQAEAFQVAQPFAFYGAIFPAIGKQFEALAIIFGVFIQLGQH